MTEIVGIGSAACMVVKSPAITQLLHSESPAALQSLVRQPLMIDSLIK
jgi:hypothetical protein